jgi:hypothetical protein
MLKGNDLVRTVIPRTTPIDLVMRNPLISNVVVVCILGSYFIFRAALAAARDPDEPRG